MEIWYLIPLAILVPVTKSPWFKGKAGESVVNLTSRFALDKTHYHLIKNVTLLTEDGTTQIDHIIVSQLGSVRGRNEDKKGENFQWGGSLGKCWSVPGEHRVIQLVVLTNRLSKKYIKFDLRMHCEFRFRA